METKDEERIRLMSELGEAMNENFSKAEMVQLYHFLTKARFIAEKFGNTKYNYINFKDVLYLSGERFEITIVNVISRGIRDENFREDDRRPVEVKIELPIQSTQDNGMKSRNISLSSVGNNFGGMLYKDFLDFLRIYNDWLRNYNKDIYKYSNLKTTKDGELTYIDFDDQPKKKGNWLTNLFKKKKTVEDQDEYYPDEY